jgi:hypothetical protein
MQLKTPIASRILNAPDALDYSAPIAKKHPRGAVQIAHRFMACFGHPAGE